MASRSTHSRAEIEDRLWRELENHQTVMLGLAGGPPRHMRPMTAFREAGRPEVWFFVHKDNDLLQETGAGHAATMCVMNPDRSFIASIGGTLSEDYDPRLIQKFWNSVTAAWFPEGKDDPDLTLLRLEPEDAQVWLSPGSDIRFGWEIAKANFTRREPDLGETARLSF